MIFGHRSFIALVAWNSLLFMASCAPLPEGFERPESYAYTDTDETRIGKSIQAKQVAHPGKSGFVLLANGLDAFVARAVLAIGAERSIDAQYYLFHNDLTGRLFVDQLIKAANRGVRVRLLVDDMALGGRDLGAAVLDSHPNVEVRIFNPFSRKRSRYGQFVTRFGSVTRRMHNKSFTADNQVAILGGRNIGNEYFEADPDLAFGDLDVLAIGPVVKEVSASFDLYWNNELAYPISALIAKPPSQEEIHQTEVKLKDFVAQQADSEYLQSLDTSPLATNIRRDTVRYHWGDAEVIHDHPDKIVQPRSETEFHMSTELGPYFDRVGEEVILFSPYFVPGTEGVAFLKQLRERGVRVRILTNSLASTDVNIVHAGYVPYREDLLRAGIELYELNKKIGKQKDKEGKGGAGSSKASLHAKSFVLDRREVFIGSLNLDPRSFFENTEIGVMLTSSDLAEEMGDWFDQNIDQLAFRLELQADEEGHEHIVWHGLVDGESRVFHVDPYTSFWRRFSIGFLSLLPIESQL